MYVYLVRENISGCFDCNNVCVVVEHFEQNGTVGLAFGVLVYNQLGQVSGFQQLPCHRICLELFQKWNNVDLKCENIFLLLTVRFTWGWIH